jgi:hypothetical protein
MDVEPASGFVHPSFSSADPQHVSGTGNRYDVNSSVTLTMPRHSCVYGTYAYVRTSAGHPPTPTLRRPVPPGRVGRRHPPGRARMGPPVTNAPPTAAAATAAGVGEAAEEAVYDWTGSGAGLFPTTSATLTNIRFTRWTRSWWLVAASGRLTAAMEDRPAEAAEAAGPSGGTPAAPGKGETTRCDRWVGCGWLGGGGV